MVTPRCPRARPLIRPETQKHGVPQVIVGSPFHEADLRDDLRFQPLHFSHLFRRNTSAPVRGLAVRQIDEWALFDWGGFSRANTSRRTGGVKPALTLPANRSRLPS